MRHVGFRLACLLAWLALDAMVAHWLASCAASFVALDWIVAWDTELGRALWLALFLYLARHSVGKAVAFADRYLSRPAAS